MPSKDKPTNKELVTELADKILDRCHRKKHFEEMVDCDCGYFQNQLFRLKEKIKNV